MADIRTGKSDIDTKSLGHIKGVKSGNSVGNYEAQLGHLPDGRRTSEASTGIDPEHAGPIDRRMPNLTPG